MKNWRLLCVLVTVPWFSGCSILDAIGESLEDQRSPYERDLEREVKVWAEANGVVMTNAAVRKFVADVVATEDDLVRDNKLAFFGQSTPDDSSVVAGRSGRRVLWPNKSLAETLDMISVGWQDIIYLTLYDLKNRAVMKSGRRKGEISIRYSDIQRPVSVMTSLFFKRSFRCGATVTVFSTPLGAEIVVDGEMKGWTESKIYATCGEHEFLIHIDRGKLYCHHHVYIEDQRNRRLECP